MALALACFAVAARGAALFETVHALALPKGDHGYRGINGDLVQPKDGAILTPSGRRPGPQCGRHSSCQRSCLRCAATRLH